MANIAPAAARCPQGNAEVISAVFQYASQFLLYPESIRFRPARPIIVLWRHI